MTPRRYLGWLSFAFFSFTFLLCVLMDYAIADWWLVQLPYATPAMFWYDSISPPIVYFVQFIGLSRLLMSYGILSFGIVSFASFAISVLLLFALKLYKGRLRAFMDSFLLYGGASLLLFESGLMILDPGEFFIHVTNFTASLPWLTNEVVMYGAYLAFSAGIVLKVILYMRSRMRTVKSETLRV